MFVQRYSRNISKCYQTQKTNRHRTGLGISQGFEYGKSHVKIEQNKKNIDVGETELSGSEF